LQSENVDLAYLKKFVYFILLIFSQKKKLKRNKLGPRKHPIENEWFVIERSVLPLLLSTFAIENRIETSVLAANANLQTHNQRQQ
jgi:hypothetical protein